MYVKNIYAVKDNNLCKSWIALICCSSRSAYLDKVPDCYEGSCIEVLKRFITVHCAPKVIISDNGPSFSAEDKAFLCSKGIIWKHNILKAPPMEVIFERMIRCMMRCLRKVLVQARVNCWHY